MTHGTREPIRTPRRTKLRLASLAAASAVLLSACDFDVYSLPLPGGTDVGDDPIHVTVMFRDVLDLVPQSTVKVDDVSVGKVEEVELQGYTAKVSIALRKDVKLPDNALAEIRQTSLLGEKFVSLKAPETDASDELLGEGDTIPLKRSGNNAEVEEVLGALSLILNGGGVAQLKTITNELNTAFEGREDSIRSVLGRLDLLMGQLDANRTQIVTALERVNNLSESLNDNTDVLDSALDELPSAIESIDGQREGLVKMLQALNRLSAVGTRVIEASKEGTIDSLDALAPILRELADAGDSVPKSLQIVLTYPFVDAVVGTNPTQARDLHMGDYQNLSIKLELDLRKGTPAVGLPGGGSLPPIPLPLPDLPNIPIPDLGIPGLGGALGGNGGGAVAGGQGGKDDDKGSGSGSGSSGSGGLGGLFGLGRAPVGAPSPAPAPAGATALDGIDTDLAAMLVWGLVQDGARR